MHHLKSYIFPVKNDWISIANVSLPEGIVISKKMLKKLKTHLLHGSVIKNHDVQLRGFFHEIQIAVIKIVGTKLSC